MKSFINVIATALVFSLLVAFVIGVLSVAYYLLNESNWVAVLVGYEAAVIVLAVVIWIINSTVKYIMRKGEQEP